jgi:hypothetical protein
MIKHFTTTCSALFLFIMVSAQDIYKPDTRLSDCFSSAEISQMVATKSELIPYYNYYLNNSYYAVDLKKAEKEFTGIDIHTVMSQTMGNEAKHFLEVSYSKETFNPLLYHFNLQKDSYVTYIWKEAGVAIVFYPLSYISNAFKELSKNRTN